MIPLPWLIIGWAASLAITAAAAWTKGDAAARLDMLAAAGQAQIASVRLANRYTAEDIEAARLAAERAARARLRAQKLTHELEMEAMHGRLLLADTPAAAPGQPAAPAPPAGPVRISAAGIRMLNDGIAAYNAAAGAAAGSADPVPAAPEPRPERRQGRAGPTAAAVDHLRLSRYLRWHASGGRGVAEAAD